MSKLQDLIQGLPIRLPFYFLSITFEVLATIASICCCLRFSQITKYLKTSLLMLAFLVLTSGHFYAQEPTPKPINEKVVIKIPNADPLYQKIRLLSNAADAFSGEFATVNNLVLKKDSAVFTLRSGEVYFLKPAQERTVGAVFFGDGEFSLSPQVDVEKKHLKLFSEAKEFTEQASELVIFLRTPLKYADKIDL